MNIKGPVELAGGPDDIWVFQVSGRMTQAVGSIIVRYYPALLLTLITFFDY